MRDLEPLRNRILTALGLAAVASGCATPTAPATATTAADTTPTDSATDSGVADGGVADVQADVGSSVPPDAVADSVADTSAPDSAVQDTNMPDSAAETSAPDSAKDTAPADETAQTADAKAPPEPVCSFGKAAYGCYSASELKYAIDNPSMGGAPSQDAGPSDAGSGYAGPLPPQGCPDPAIVKDGCCMPGVGEALLDGDKCCFWRCVGACCGRPFVVAGQTRVAPLVEQSAWTAESPKSAELSQADADALASAWRADGADEHASVASFLRFGLDLLACGAPPDLVAAASLAAVDEVKHAQLCFALASNLDGRAVGPGALDCSGIAPRADLASAVTAAVREGCIGETLAAAMAGAAARLAVDPATAQALQVIAEDEARHAELAWRFVAWAVAADAAARDAAQAAFAQALSAVPPADPRAALLHAVPSPVRAHWGRVPAERWAPLARAVLVDVVAPAAAALFA